MPINYKPQTETDKRKVRLKGYKDKKKNKPLDKVSNEELRDMLIDILEDLKGER